MAPEIKELFNRALSHDILTFDEIEQLEKYISQHKDEFTKYELERFDAFEEWFCHDYEDIYASESEAWA